MAIDGIDYEASDPDEWEDFDPDREEEIDEFDGFEVYDSQDDYLMRYVESIPPEVYEE